MKKVTRSIGRKIVLIPHHVKHAHIHFQKHFLTRQKGILLLIMMLIGIGLSNFFPPPLAHAATYTWDGGGADNNWSTCANWTLNTCPTSTDSVTFDGTSSKDSTIDVSFQGTISSMNISGYSGTITQARSLTISTTYSQSSGIFSTADQSLSVSNNFILSGGTFNLNSTSLTLSSTPTFSGGTFNGGSGTLTTNSGYNLTIGASNTFTAPATLNIGSNLTIFGTFNHNSGTVNFNGSNSSQMITCTGSPFNLITVTQTGSGASFTVGSGCTIPLGANPTVQVGYLSGMTVNGVITGSGTLKFKGYSNGTTWYNPYVAFSCGTTCLSGFSGLDLTSANNATSGNYFTVSTTGTVVDLSSYSTFNIVSLNVSGGTLTLPNSSSTTISGSGAFALSSGTLNLNGSTLIFSINATFSGGTFNGGSGTLTTNSGYNLTIGASNTFTAPPTMNLGGNLTILGTFNHNSGTVNFTATAGIGQTVTCTGSPFNLVTITQTSSLAAFTVSSGCTIPLGANPTVQVGYLSGMTVNGVITGSGTLKFKGYSNGTTWYNPYVAFSCGTTCLSGFSGLDLTSANNATNSTALTVTTTGTVIDLSSYSTFNIASLSVSGGTLTFPTTGSNTISSPGAFTLSGGTLNLNGSTLILATAPTFSGGTFNGGSGTLTTNSGYNLTIGASNTFTAPPTMNLGGNLTILGTFNHNSGTVNFNGSTSQIISGAGTFNNVGITGGSTKTMTLPASTTQTILNNLTITGTGSGSRVLLRSSSLGTQWGIDVRGSSSVVYANIQDSNACQSVGRPLIATNSTNSTNNSCWTFVTSGAQNPTFILKGVTIGPGTTITAN